MEKLESSLKNMLISLGGIALVCALLLSVVNALTEKKILKVTEAKTDDTTVAGYAIETSTAGFGGPLNLMVGFTSEGRICSTDVISHTETPGLGAKITDASSHFRTQFESRNPAEFNLAIKKNGGDVDAISASTITSQAFTSAVAKAYSVYLAASGNGADAVSSATPQAGEGGSDEAN